MRTIDHIKRIMNHEAMINVGVDDHHLQPFNIQIENTTLDCPPLPGGPAVWDVSIPYASKVIMFTFRSPKNTDNVGAKAGVSGIATRDSTEASTISIGGFRSLPQFSEASFYTKPSSAVNLSHKIFNSSVESICLTDVVIFETVPGLTRVFRTYWNNYSSSIYTLDCRGQISVYE